MSKRPPEDNPLIEKILKELEVSITDIDLDSKEAMKEALRDSMGLWFPNIGLQPELSVLDGAKSDRKSDGKSDGHPLGGGHETDEVDVDEVHEADETDETDESQQANVLRSQFQLLSDDESLFESGFESGFESEDDGLPNVQVRVLSPQDLLSAGHGLFGIPKKQNFASKTSKVEVRRGSIVLETDEKLTLVQRSQATTYRISCDQGAFKVMIDGETFVLRGGQSMDIESNSIVLMGGETSLGWYQSI